MTDLSANISRSARNQLLTIALATTALIYPVSATYALEAGALPGGEVVIGGSASFDRDTKNTLNIKQGTDRLVIDWHEGFNIGAKATTNFYQPDISSIVVNRVVGKSDNPTQILGSLNANGRVLVLDRNGVIFGKDSKIDVGSLIASTGEINVKDFMKDSKTLALDNIADGKIVNNGTITVSETGLAAFVAPTVRNNGLIVARMGTVLMGNAETVTFDLYGDGLIEVATGKNLKQTAIENSGKIDVEGGNILLTSVAVDGVVKNLVNTRDIIKSDTFKIVNGKIVLSKYQNKDEKKKANAEKREAKRLERLKQKEEKAVAVVIIPAPAPAPVEVVIAPTPVVIPPASVTPPAAPVVAVTPVPTAPVTTITAAPAPTSNILTTTSLRHMLLSLKPKAETSSDNTIILEIESSLNPNLILIEGNVATTLNTLGPAAGDQSSCGTAAAFKDCHKEQ